MRCADRTSCSQSQEDKPDLLLCQQSFTQALLSWAIFVIPQPSPQALSWKVIGRSATHWFNAMRSAGLMQCLVTTGTVNAGLRALKDTHGALGDEVKKDRFYFANTKMKLFWTFWIIFYVRGNNSKPVFFVEKKNTLS